MKLYKFYKIPDDEINKSGLSDTLKYPLYAFTRYKKVAKEFEELHRKGIFKLVITEVDKKEFAEFAKTYRGCALEYNPLDSYIRTNHVKVTYDILMTLNEFNYVDSLCDVDALMNTMSEIGLVNIEIFSKKYKKKLNKLFYNTISKMNDVLSDLDKYPDEYVENIIDDIDNIGIEFNTLNLYIGLYDEILDMDIFLTKLV